MHFSAISPIFVALAGLTTASPVDSTKLGLTERATCNFNKKKVCLPISPVGGSISDCLKISRCEVCHSDDANCKLYNSGNAHDLGTALTCSNW